METTEEEHLDDKDSFSKMTEEQISEWKREALSRPGDFGYFGDREGMFETWTLGPTIETRDSDIREKSNAQAIKAMLKSDPSLEEDWEITGCKHWAVGWVDHLSFRVLDDEGELTRIARVVKGVFDTLSEYPVLDDSLHFEMLHDATMDNIRNHYHRGTGGLKEDVPEDWANKMYSWWSEREEYSAIDDEGYDQGGSPSDEQFEECARALGFWDTSEDEEEDE